MSTKRKVQNPDVLSTRGPARPWPPRCEACGFIGEPTETASPYKACGGNPARHQRTPIGARS